MVQLGVQRNASAVWKGGLKDGTGAVSAGSGAFTSALYSFSSRFESARGTNPEELVAAAHAGCFSMALSGELGKVGLRPDTIETKATLDFEKLDAGWTITSIHLDVAAKVPGANPSVFQKAAEMAKATCPISRVLNAKITMQAKLV